MSFRWNRYVGVPVMLGVIAALILLVTAGVSLPSGLGALLIVVAGGFAGRLLARTHTQDLATARRAGMVPVEAIRDLCVNTLPVWHRQLDTSRVAADSAVGELTHLFAGITDKLEKVMQSGHLEDSKAMGGRNGMLKVIEHSGVDLGGLVDALRLTQESRDEMVRDIGAQAARLVENAAEVRGIAMQTRLLTLNAAIEAARAGAVGAPFAVIVGDMRQLTARASEIGEKISKQTEILNSAVKTAFMASAEQDSNGISITRAQEIISGVVTRFQSVTGSLSEDIESMERERSEVRGDISNALVQLQFQDRVSQILAHVTRSMESLSARVVDASQGAHDFNGWLDEMSSSFTTLEEFENLGQRPLDKRSESREVTFF
jgi:methyl-accepting chemotaxis protein